MPSRAARCRSARRRPPARSGPSWGRRRAGRPSRAASWPPRGRRGRTVVLVAAGDDHAAGALRALAVAHDQQRELAQERVERLPERSSSSDSGSTRTPLAPRAIRIAVSLVESWPSTEMRSNERLTHTPSSRSAVSRRERGVGLDEAQHRREVGLDHPGALALRAEADGAAGSVTSTRALGERVGRADRLRERLVASLTARRAPRAGPSDPIGSSCTPMTPVDAIAT